MKYLDHITVTVVGIHWKFYKIFERMWFLFWRSKQNHNGVEYKFYCNNVEFEEDDLKFGINTMLLICECEYPLFIFPLISLEMY